MCTNIKFFNESGVVNGYKVAFYDQGNYWSIMTGVKYQLGEIPGPSNQQFHPDFKKIINKQMALRQHPIGWEDHPLQFISETGSLFNKDAIARSSLFKSVNDAYNIYYSLSKKSKYDLILLNIQARAVGEHLFGLTEPCYLVDRFDEFNKYQVEK